MNINVENESVLELTTNIVQNISSTCGNSNNFDKAAFDSNNNNSFFIVRGNFHQNDQRFSKKSRGNQCTANATAAIFMSTYFTLQEWNASVIDAVLDLGDLLYLKSIEN